MDTLIPVVFAIFDGDCEPMFNTSIIFVSHDLAVVAQIADRVAIMHEGQIVEMPVDVVIVALGTNPNPIIQRSAKSDNLNLETDKKGYIIVDKETGKTSIEGVFAGGDAVSGPATVIIEGISTGMMSTAIPVITVCFGMLLAYGFAGGFENPAMGLYGIGIAAVGMLSTLGITLATDAYGPIANNAGGNAQMSGMIPEVRKRTDALDSLLIFKAATGKGFAIGSAALTAMAL